jgi:hypothetical protein
MRQVSLRPVFGVGHAAPKGGCFLAEGAPTRLDALRTRLPETPLVSGTPRGSETAPSREAPR